MKQVSDTKNCLVLSSPLHDSINRQTVFSKYRFVILLACFGMHITSCQKEELQGTSQKQDLLTNSEKQNQHKKAVPFKAKFETLDRGQFDSTHEQITGTGEGTHIGKSTFVSFVYFVNFPSVSGTSTIYAANGDQISSTFSGSVVGPDENGNTLVTNNNRITGGTGRFKGATGSFIAHGIANLNVLTFDGTISY